MKKILCFTIVLIMLLGTVSVSVSAFDIHAPREEKYREFIVPRLGIEIEGYPKPIYFELFEYSNNTEEPSATPDYVLVVAASAALTPTESESDVFGEWVVYVGPILEPYHLGLHVYLPKEDKLYTLREAWDLPVEGIEAVFTEYEENIGRRIGDTNDDNEINIKDATLIQKSLTGLEEIPYDEYGPYGKKKGFISDFNRDGERNVKDATAIQKHIAGLEY